MNNVVESMIKKYACKDVGQYERALKEILQELTLVGLNRSRFFEHAAFYGGTALRILYGLDRFSEDLDFSLLKSDKEFSLDSFNKAIERELNSFGFDVEVETKKKASDSIVDSAFIKANTMEEMIKIGIPRPFLKGFHPESKMKIKLEVDRDPPLGFKTDTRPLKEPVPVGIRTLVPEDLMAGKMHALLFREWKLRIKGRDWYDWIWSVRSGIPIHLGYLEQKMKQSGNFAVEDTLTRDKFLQLIRKKIDQLDLKKAIDDVVPFLYDEIQIANWSKDLFYQLLDETKTI